MGMGPAEPPLWSKLSAVRAPTAPGPETGGAVAPAGLCLSCPGPRAHVAVGAAPWQCLAEENVKSKAKVL